MAELGIDIAGHCTKGLAAVPTSAIDLVVVLCADGHVAGLPPALERLDWELPDPAAVCGDDATRLAAFRTTRDELARRVEILASRLAERD